MINLAVILAVAIAAAADLWTTHLNLSQPGGREYNPLMRWFLVRWGFAGLAGVKLAITGGLVWFAFATGYPLLALIPGVMAAGAAWHNWRGK